MGQRDRRGAPPRHPVDDGQPIGGEQQARPVPPQDGAEREQRGNDEQRGPDHAGDPVRLADDDEDGSGRREDERSQERPDEGRAVWARIEADLVT